MVCIRTFAAARPLRALCILTLFISAATVTYANTALSSPIGEASPGTKVLTVNTNKVPSQSAVKPLWTDLTLAQQQALAPLSSEWDKLDGLRKKKWLELSNNFASRKPEEQRRIQERMREWIKLTPEQRRAARENYIRTKKLSAGQKTTQWQQYQQLPEEQKKKLAADSANKKHVANLPSAAQNKEKTVPPIRSARKRVQEQPVIPIPQATTQSPPLLPPLQPSSSPQQPQPPLPTLPQ